MSVILSNADATTPERFQAEFARRLDQVLSALTPMDAQYRCATAWFEQLGISGNTANATVHLESWFNPNTAPAAAIDPTNLLFKTLCSDDSPPETLTLNVVNTSPYPLFIESVTLAGLDAGAFDVWWNAVGNPSLAGRGTVAIQVSVRPEGIAKLAPGVHTATLNFLTANGTPALLQIPLTITLAAPLFVDQRASPGGHGSSWSNAFQTISAAVAAAPTGDEAIFVAEGTYAEAVALRGSLHLYGGGANATLRRCWIAGNDAATTNGSGSGGGLYIYASGQATVEDTRFLGNAADSAAGFQVGGGGDCTLRGVLVAANISRGWFGGGSCYGQCALQADQCVFFRNSAGPGYGFAGLGTVYGATSIVQNCIFAGHQNAGAAGLGWGGSLGILEARHCLFYGNTKDFSDGTHNATGAAQLNALTNVFTNAFAADPKWLVPPLLAGTVTDATYDAANYWTVLTLSGASLTPGSLRGQVLNKGATAAAAVFTNTAATITVFGRHDTLAPWTHWQPLDFHLANGSPAIDVGIVTSSVLDPDGFPRGVDLPEVPNGPGGGFDLGLYEYHGPFESSPLLLIQPEVNSVKLLWPLGLPAWRIYSSPDLRHWTTCVGAPLATNGWQQLSLPRGQALEFYRLGTP